MFKIVRRSIGITICPEKVVESELAETSLVKLPWGGWGMDTSILMIWHAEKWCSPVLSRFVITREVFRWRCDGAAYNCEALP
jgi:DNA-binding transcriptional LysR family regulator